MKSRFDVIRKIIADCQLDGILFSNMNNIRYLTGFTGSAGFLLMTSAEARLLVDGRYITQAEFEVRGIPVDQYQNQNQGIEQAVQKLHLKKVGFEAASVSVEQYNDLVKNCGNVEWIALSDELRMLRACKDDQELTCMKKAAAIASAAIAELARELKPGWTEIEAALHLEMIARRGGAEQIAFETIIASGENAALPHAKPTHRRIRHGDLLVIDFGVKFQGYCSDETCTFAIGELTAAQKNAYRAILRAHDEAIAFLEAGRAAADVDTRVRGVLGEKYERCFTHGTGHGVGLEVHEAPRLAKNSQDVLHTGMVVTIEPGLYYPGLWGIRIEDTVFIRDHGCDIITGMSKEIIVIE